VDLNNPKDCLKKFKSNKWLGLIIFSAVLAGVLYGDNQSQDEQKDEN